MSGNIRSVTPYTQALAFKNKDNATSRWVVKDSTLSTVYCPNKQQGALPENPLYNPDDHFALMYRGGYWNYAGGIYIDGADFGFTQMFGDYELDREPRFGLFTGIQMRAISGMGLQVSSGSNNNYTDIVVEGVKKNLPDTSWRGAYLMGVRLVGAISIPDSDVKTTQVRGINVKGFNSGVSVQNGVKHSLVDGIVEDCHSLVDWNTNNQSTEKDASKHVTLRLKAYGIDSFGLNQDGGSYNAFDLDIEKVGIALRVNDTGKVYTGCQHNNYRRSASDVTQYGADLVKVNLGKFDLNLKGNGSYVGEDYGLRVGANVSSCSIDSTVSGFKNSSTITGVKNSVRVISESSGFSIGGVQNNIEYIDSKFDDSKSRTISSTLSDVNFKGVKLSLSGNNNNVRAGLSSDSINPALLSVGGNLNIFSANIKNDLETERFCTISGSLNNGKISAEGKASLGVVVSGTRNKLEITCETTSAQAVLVSGNNNIISVNTNKRVVVSGSGNILIGFCGELSDTGVGNNTTSIVTITP